MGKIVERITLFLFFLFIFALGLIVLYLMSETYYSIKLDRDFKRTQILRNICGSYGGEIDSRTLEVTCFSN